MNPKFTTWSPSRYGDYDRCPLMAKLKHIDKLCPSCFDGRIMGGFDCPAVCDSCGVTLEVPKPLARGTLVGDAHDAYIVGKAKTPHVEVRHPKVLEITKQVRDLYKKGQAKIQLDLIFDRNWRLLKKTGDYAPKGWWAWLKLDAFLFLAVVAGRVLDWKTGGIDKRTGAVRVDSKYDDQLFAYSVAGMHAFPQVESITSALVFLDCGPRFEPVMERDVGAFSRKDLPKLTDKLNKKLIPMMADEEFSPRPGDHCKICDFQKAKGGPCRY